MSGIEIVGLVLSLLPVVISAVGACQAPSLDQKSKDFLENLSYEITILRMTIQTLANSLTGLSGQLREKLLRPQSPDDFRRVWMLPVVVEAIKARLDPGAEVFLLTLRSIVDLLNELLKSPSLDLLSSELVSPERVCAKVEEFHNKSWTSSDLRNRVRFVLRERKRNCRILDKIKGYNEKLERIVGSPSSVEETVMQSKSGRAVGVPHIELRALLHTLYATIGDSWPCKSHLRHEARLGLRKLHDAPSAESEHIYFEMLMSVRTEQYHRWLESQLCIVLQQDEEPPTKGEVRFDLPEPATAVTDRRDSAGNEDSISSDVTLTKRRSSDSTTWRKVETFCKTLSQANRNTCSPQILFDGTSLWHVVSKPSARRLSQKSSLVDKSLASLLRERKLRRKDKKILSVILANSLLHFCESPWLDKDWSKEHITFFSTAADVLPDLRRPYLSTDFLNERAEEEEGNNAIFRLHPNAGVLALGILLLEIEQNSTIESQWEPEDLDENGEPTVNTNFFTASKLFKSIAEDMYCNSRKAVDACLKCNFYDLDVAEPSLDDPNFRQAVYENIILPLERELYHAYELTPDDLGLQTF